MGYILKIGEAVVKIGNNILANINTLTSSIIDVTFDRPAGVALDIANDRYYICESDTNSVRIMKYSDNTEIATVSGFSSPRGIALDIANNRYYVCNLNADSVRIMKYSDNTEIDTINAQSSYKIALDIANNNIFISTFGNDKLRILTYKYI